METALQPAWLTVDEYLSGELQSEIRHEYIGGVVYAMAGASEEHNTVAGSIYAALRSHLRGKACRPFIADVKVRLKVGGENIFYYPDVLVAGDPRDTDRFFKRYPKVLIEVLSETTERTDRREKFLSYTQIESLEEYVLVAQDKVEVSLFRRTTGWRPEILNQPNLQLRFASIDFGMPLDAIYEDVKL